MPRKSLPLAGAAVPLLLFLLLAAGAGAGQLDATWTAPTTNTDGSPLTDLANYRVYYATTPAPCPAGTFVVQPSPTTTPAPNTTVKLANGLTGLVTGSLYYVSVAAVDAGGTPSLCSAVASMIARADPLSITIGSRVIALQPVAARSTPSTASAILQLHPTGDTGTVIGGPTVADGWTWWSVRYDAGLSGWSTEAGYLGLTTVLPPALPLPVVNPQIRFAP